MSENQGQCLCGKVKFTAPSLSNSLGACHCTMCRQWTGGPFMAVDCGKDVAFEGEENIQRYSSSEWAERGFCKNCGTSLFYYLKPSQQYMMLAGLFPELKNIKFDHQIFIDSKPAYYDFANQTKNMTGEEAFAQFSGGDN